MAGSGKRGGGDRVLESRHLVGLFLGVVILCGVFFTLGYVMGHTQYDAAVHAADATLVRPEVSTRPKPKSSEAEKPPAPAVGEWDFYSNKEDDHMQAAPEGASPSASTSASPRLSAGENEPSRNRTAEKPGVTPAKLPAHFQPPRMTKSAMVLQLAALRRQSDALAMADALQQKRFPSFVVTPTTDNFYRVQVGPYATEAEAEAAKRELDRQGFKAIIKR
jgi:DedD protein